MSHEPSKAALAAETWKLLFRFFISTRAQRDEVLGRYAITPNDMRALTSLEARTGRTMRSLAEQWRCDASNATWIIDRLERRNLAARTTPEHDRRVKQVVLTPAGEKLRREVLRALDRPPRELIALNVSQLAALRDAFAGLSLPITPRLTKTSSMRQRSVRSRTRSPGRS